MSRRRRRCKMRFAKPLECFEDGIGPSPKEECTYTDELQRDSRNQPSLDGSKGWWELLNVGVNLLDQGISFVVLTGLKAAACSNTGSFVSSGNSWKAETWPNVGSSWFCQTAAWLSRDLDDDFVLERREKQLIAFLIIPQILSQPATICVLPMALERTATWHLRVLGIHVDLCERHIGMLSY